MKTDTRFDAKTKETTYMAFSFSPLLFFTSTISQEDAIRKYSDGLSFYEKHAPAYVSFLKSIVSGNFLDA